MPRELLEEAQISDGDTVEVEVRHVGTAARLWGKWQGKIDFGEAVRYLEELDEAEGEGG